MRQTENGCYSFGNRVTSQQSQSYMMAMGNVRNMEIVLVAALLVGYLVSRVWPRKEQEPNSKFVYVNQDGSARELSPAEQGYLEEEFMGGDSGRPYIKSSYDSVDGWGSQSGFIDARKVPTDISILPVHPNYDVLEKELRDEWLASHRVAGDIIEENADGSITCTPNPDISREERFEIMRQHRLAEQRHREALARI